MPPSLRPDGYAEGAPAKPHAGHPDIPIEILPFLMLGTFKTASDNNLITAMGISALLNCCSEEFEEDELVDRECMFMRMYTCVYLITAMVLVRC